MVHRVRGTWLAPAVCLLVAARAAAAQIDYQADPGCPDQGTFLTAVAQKSSGATTGMAGAGTLKVQLRATPAGYTGVLERATEGASAPRVLSAARCEDVVEGLALTLALSLVPPVEPPAAVVAVAPAPRPPARGRAVTASLGVRAGGFVSGQPMMGPALAVGFSPRERRSWTVGLEGGLQLSWNRSDLALAPNRARFELLALALAVCPLHVGGERARLGLCGLAEGGLLGGQGIDVAHPRWGRAGWLALGGGLDLEVGLTRRWRLMGGAQVTRPLRKTRFVFAEPAEPVAGTSGLAPSATLAVGARFP
jgi:hypothetical protein